MRMFNGLAEDSAAVGAHLGHTEHRVESRPAGAAKTLIRPLAP
jgi:hypothetical protein